MGLSIMIVDDEPYIRSGIKAKLDLTKNKFDLIEEACDAMDAKHKFNLHPYDIVITDIKMPEIDGITLIKILKSMRSECKFVIISGYAEFELAKEAISLDVKEYILKPVDPNELNDAISRILKLIIKEREQKSVIDVDEMLCDIVFKKTFNHRLKSYMPQAITSNKYFMISVMKIKQNKIIDNIDVVDKNQVSLKAAVKKIILEDNTLTYFRNYKTTNEYIFIFGCKREYKEIKKPIKIMSKIMHHLRFANHIDSAVGMGEVIQGIDTLWQSYYQAYCAVSEKMIKGYGKIFSFREIREKSKRIPLTEDKRELLVDYLYEGNQFGMNHFINQMLDEALLDEDISYTSIKGLCEHIYLCIKDFLNKHNYSAELYLGEKFDFSNEFLKFENMEQVRDLMNNIVTFAISNIENNDISSGEDIVRVTMQYIDENYNQDISLTLISRKYHINKNYFCRIFKEISGFNFTEYLTNIRICKACEIMESTNLKLYKIAELVGYNDPKYFSKVFKNEKGISPSQYLRYYRIE